MLANGTDATVRKVVDIVHRNLGITYVDEILHDRNDVINGKRCHIKRNGHAELLIDAIATYNAEVIALRIEEQFLKKAPCCIQIRWIG